jgi:hypothetical protein
MKEKWIEIKSTVRCFQLGGEPELIHIIKTGFKDQYLVVHEDAYEQQLGQIDFETIKSINSKYNITLD